MSDKYFVTRDSSTVYFTDAHSTPKQDARTSALPKTEFVKGTLGSGGSLYSTSSARVVVKKYALKRD